MEQLKKTRQVTSAKCNLELSSPLHQASKNGNIPLISRLLEEGAKLNQKDRAGYNPFMDAINHGGYAIGIFPNPIFGINIRCSYKLYDSYTVQPCIIRST